MREIFVIGLEINLQVAVIGLDESAGNDGSGKAGSVPNEARRLIAGLGRMLRTWLGSAANHRKKRRNRDVDTGCEPVSTIADHRKPTCRIQQIARIRID